MAQSFNGGGFKPPPLGRPNENAIILPNALQWDSVASNDKSVEFSSYAGSDIMCTIFIPVPNIAPIRDMGQQGSIVGGGHIKLNMELQTLTVSSARSVHPVRRIGEVAPATYTRGARTIAGTMIFTTLFRDAFADIYQKSVEDGETDLENFFVDQIPKFNMLVSAANEYGESASSVLTGIHLTNFGTTLSIDDMYTEATYCLSEDTQALTMRGWKYHYEILSDDKMLTINPDTKSIEWQTPKSINTFDYHGDLIHWKNYRGVDVLSTPNHRWMTIPYRKKDTLSSSIKFEETKDLIGAYRKIVMSGGISDCFPEEKTISDEMVELIGWVVTEGTINYSENGTAYGITVSQDMDHNPECVNNIRTLVSYFKIQGATTSEGHSKAFPSQRKFYFGKGIAKDILKHIPNRSLTPELLCSLTYDQALLLLNTMISADGHISKSSSTKFFIQNPGKNNEMFQMLCSMLGKRTSCKKRSGSIIRSTTIYRSEIISCAHLEDNRVKYDGVVWCPTTENSTWLARRNGNTFWTGNSYVARQWYPFVDNSVALNMALSVPDTSNTASEEVKRTILKRNSKDGTIVSPTSLDKVENNKAPSALTDEEILDITLGGML